MGMLSWVVMGLIVGVLAQWIMPGKNRGRGLVITIVLGISGAFVGGYIASQLGFGAVSGFDLKSLLIATGGAVLLLWAVRELGGK